ncbi:cobalt-precorrin-5B (C(1))-methyltransferase CbiD [Lentisphaerota bacterium WC36G]|nr:cobalt-precorrin-5B (C(1))-methyltransferase CbiD [Lentisphaerae bacterium WC36]
MTSTFEHKKQNLRSGFSTGACATSAAVKAYCYLKKIDFDDQLLFLDGKVRYLGSSVDSVDFEQKVCIASIIKDAGDDPDVTNKAKISIKVSLNESAANMSNKQNEYCLTKEIKVDENRVLICHLYGGEGIGVVTRSGLPVKKGLFAINPKPVEMILKNLQIVINKFNLLTSEFKCEEIFIEISIQNGVEIAKKTLNKSLGIIGGLSILGTTGIVRPYSHESYIATIKIQLDAIINNGLKNVAICTGVQTEKAIIRDFKHSQYSITKENCVRIADFISESLNYINEQQFDNVIVGCMIGKLYKYACGLKNTHAHKNALDTHLIIKLLRKYFVNENIISEIAKLSTIRQIKEEISIDIWQKLEHDIMGLALINLRKWCPNCYIKLLLYNHDNSLIRAL